MKYLFLLYGDEAAEDALTPDERRAIVESHMALGRELSERGVLISAEALQAASTAIVVHRAGERAGSTTAGPFAETIEQLGAFYLVDCVDESDARALAGRFPLSPGLVVGIRPVSG